MIDAHGLEDGDYFLAYDTREGEQDWALWQIRDGVDYLIVDWEGCACEDEQPFGPTEWMKCYRLYLIRPENVDTIIMASRHMTTEQWYRFAWRQSERQALDVG